MRSFQGKLRLADHPTEAMGAGLEVAAGSLSLIISDQAVAAWPLAQVDIEVETDGFHFIVDGEEFIFVTRNAAELAEAVGLFEREHQNGGRTKTLRRPEPKPAGSKPAKRRKAPPAASKPTKSRMAPPAASPRAKSAPRPKRQMPWADVQLPEIDFKSRTARLGIAGLVAALLLGIFLRPLLAFGMMGVGSLGLLLGTGAIVDPIMATRLPSELTAGRTVLISVVLLLVGMLVLVV